MSPQCQFQQIQVSNSQHRFPDDDSSSEAGLRREIGLPQATAMVVGTIIGAAIFVQPADVTGRVPSVSGILLVWLASGILTLFGALVCAELASAYPRSGGVYVFLRESIGKPLGFLWGWAMFWTMHTGIIAAIAMVFARYTARFVELDDTGIRSVAIAVILFLSAVNLRGVRHGARLQTFFTAGKLVAIAAIIVVGFAFGGNITDSALQGGSMAADRSISVNDYLLAMVAGLFAFGGWHMVTYTAGETAEARRTIPRALVIGTLVVTACYILLNTVYLYVLPLETVASSDRIAAAAAEVVLGGNASAAISGLVMFSTFGAVAGIILMGPRVYYAMAQDGLIFRWIGAVHPVRGTPDRAIILQALWASVLVATGTYGQLVSRVIYTEWIFFGLMAVGLIVLRRRGVQRRYSVPGYPFVPLIFAFAAFVIAINTMISEPRDAMLGLGMVLAGLPVYYIWNALSHRSNAAR
jgi:APA family basic amino acid/polyamine antiporter